ncbi:MAG: hypothetical protein MZV65_46260 [Chromatiales bacterium]|nr:hypothetical protein [Chromatiales bacterium]
MKFNQPRRPTTGSSTGLHARVLVHGGHPGDRPRTSIELTQRQRRGSTTSTTSATAACARVGELAENQFRVGLVRVERAIKERMSHGRDRGPDAARPDQRQAGRGGGQGVLRLLAAVAVHGPDQPAVGGHATSAASRRSGPAA